MTGVDGGGTDGTSGSTSADASTGDAAGDTTDPGETDATGADPIDTDTDSGAPPLCEATEFGAAPQAWTLPEIDLPIDATELFVDPKSSPPCTNGQFFRYSTVDLTADGRIDLVVTDACDAADAGTSVWLVYPGSDEGFADAPQAWTLPELGLMLDGWEPFVGSSGSPPCTNGQFLRYSTLDLTADGRLDLVVTDACDAADAGTSAWLVYPGGDGGFADVPQAWTLPELGLTLDGWEPFVGSSGSPPCANGQFLRYSTVDLTADGWLDLVVTDACDAADAGTSAWLVYPGGDGGFADVPQAWTLPELGVTLDEREPFVGLSGSPPCNNGQFLWYSTVDLTADGRLDLVVTDACDAADVGTSAWLVYPGGDAGFADAPQAWTLPDLGVTLDGREPFAVMSGSPPCTNGQFLWYSTVDLTADGRPDLVVTDACDAADVGTSAWLVYPGGDGGFADAPQAWTLPDLGVTLDGREPFVVMSGSPPCTNGQFFRYSTMDLDGEGHLDLVVTDACDATGAGASAWLLFPGTCG